MDEPTDKPPRRKVPLGRPDRQFLLTQYQLEFVSRENVALASRFAFIIIALAGMLLDLTVASKLSAVLVISTLLGLLWAIDDRRRTARIEEFEYLLVSRMSKIDNESVSDEYIRGRYHTPFRIYAVFFRTEAILWLGLVYSIAVTQAKLLH